MTEICRKPAEGKTIGTVTLDGKTVTPVKSGSRYVVWIRDIKAADQAASQAVGQ
ncbi:MAG: hypothetical protein IJH99_08440 [Eubacterium sp.]|nr:hypothetical protein [Eubacterium sp.]